MKFFLPFILAFPLLSGCGLLGDIQKTEYQLDKQELEENIEILKLKIRKEILQKELKAQESP
jgi:hypothetical protein